MINRFDLWSVKYLNFDEINKKAKKRLLFLIILISAPAIVLIFIILEMSAPRYNIFIITILALLVAFTVPVANKVLALPATNKYALKIIKRKVESISPETEMTMVPTLFHPYLRFADFDLKYTIEPKLIITFRSLKCPPFVALWDENLAKWSLDIDEEFTKEGDNFQRRLLEMLRAVSNEKFRIESISSGEEEQLVLIAAPGELYLNELLARIGNVKKLLGCEFRKF